MSEGHTKRLESALSGRYRVEKKLGEGGMASVYLAEDLKHERKVALKILKPELAAVIGAERFLTEIKTTANLQHPHILPLFDSGEADGFLYYVMPYIDGESLRERLDREGQLGVEESVSIARDVADALDYAHRNDVIHRDIKPANILLHDGRPVVADFGIALAISAAGGGRMTETGLSLGTPHYMSPEQASADRDLSARSDVYSLGCVLYEMLAGQPPHVGPSAQSVLVRILTEDPRPITDLRRSVPPHVAAAVTKATEKLPADRFETARQLMEALTDGSFRYTSAPRAPSRAPAEAAGPPVGLASWDIKSRALAAAVVALGALSAWLGLRSVPAPPGPVISFVALDSARIGFPAVAPDGAIGYQSRDTLYVRAPGALGAASIYEASDILLPGLSFSPDGAWIAFVEREGTGPEGETLLRKIPSSGGPVATLWSSTERAAVYPVWGDDGQIYVLGFGGTGGGETGLYRVPEVGGEAEPVLSSEGPVEGLPSDVLPAGRAILFSPRLSNTSVLLDLESGDTTTVVADGVSARWSPTGHLVYEHESGALWAVPFDLGSLEPRHAPAPVVDGVAVISGFGGAFALSRSGTLVYSAGEPLGGGGRDFTFVFAGLDGSLERIPIAPSDHYDAQLSPDGARVAYTRDDDVWLFDLDLGTTDSLTAGGTGLHDPVWSPDGTRVAYRGSDGNVWARPVDRSREPTRMAGTGRDDPEQWLEDGRVLFHNEGQNQDIFAVRVEDGAEPEPILHADWAEAAPSVSPDGAWIAYLSSRDGSDQLYVRSWPDLAGEVRVSEGESGLFSTHAVLWSQDGRTLYYVQGGALHAVGIGTEGGFHVVSRAVTDVDVSGGLLLDLAPDGRFLLATSGGAEPDRPRMPERLVVVTNWFTDLRARLGEGG